MPAFGTIGGGRDQVFALRDAGGIGRPNPNAVRSGPEVIKEAPLDPSVLRQWFRQFGFLPSSGVYLDLNAGNPNVRRPGDPRDVMLACLDAASGGIDPRLGLDRRFLRPSPRNLVSIEAVPGRQLDLADPFGG